MLLLKVTGFFRVLKTMVEQKTLSMRGMKKPTISMKMTIFDRYVLQVSFEKFSKHVSEELLVFVFVVLKKLAGTLPVSTISQTSPHVIFAFIFVLMVFDRNGCTIAKKRSTLMQVRNKILPYMFV